MKHTRFAKVLVAMFAGVLMVAALGGCAQQDTRPRNSNPRTVST